MYNSSDVANKIKSLAKQNNVSVKKLLDDVGLSFNTMSNMKNSMPKADNLAKIADYFDCSIDYLMGRSDSNNKSSATSFELQKLLSSCQDLTPYQIDCLITFINALKDDGGSHE